MLNFLQKIDELWTKWENKEISILDFVAMSSMAIEIYSQPFKPEMIGEMFEPVDYIFETLIVESLDVCIVTVKQGKQVIGEFHNIRNLDELITQFQQAGIELKEKVKP